MISQEWIDASFTKHNMGTAVPYPHGFLFYNIWGSAWCAAGLGGNLVCVDRDLSRVVIQQRKDDGSGEDGSVMNSENMCVPPTALDGSLSFCAGSCLCRGKLISTQCKEPWSVSLSDTSGNVFLWGSDSSVLATSVWLIFDVGFSCPCAG